MTYIFLIQNKWYSHCPCTFKCGLFRYGTLEFYSWLRYVFFLISVLLLYQCWRDKAQRMCNCESHTQHIKMKRTLYRFWEHSRTVFVEIGTDRNGTHLKLKKNVLECCSQILSRGSLDFDMPWVAFIITCTQSLRFVSSKLGK